MNAADCVALGFCLAAAAVACGLLTRPLRQLVEESENREPVARPQAGRDNKRNVSPPKINVQVLAWSELKAQQRGDPPAYVAVWSNGLQEWMPIRGRLTEEMWAVCCPWQLLLGWPRESGERSAQGREPKRGSPR